MKRETISEALGNIQIDYIAECESYSPKLRVLPSGKEQKMGRYEQTTKHSSRKIIALVLAACLVMGLGITAYATGIPSRIAGWISWHRVTPPTDEERESRPDLAQWKDEQLEIQATLDEMAENAQIANEEKHPDGLPDATITLLESNYDGEKFVMACRYDDPQWHVTFDFDESHPLFSELQAPSEDYWTGREVWEENVSLEDDRQAIQSRLETDGHVGFSTYEFFISDHVLVNGEDPGFSHSEPRDNDDGTFYVDPYYTSAFGPDLPASCQNLPELTVTFTVRCAVTHYWLDGNSVRWADGDRLDYPISFTIPNVNS